jgi:hypothetical protein
MQTESMGIDLGKGFYAVALGKRSKVVIRKRFFRQQLLNYTANLPPCIRGGNRNRIALSGARVARAGARCAIDSGAVCAALREVGTTTAMRKQLPRR